MIGFMNPWLLLGLAAVGLPLVIHALTRARSRRIALPTYHMLIESGGGLTALHRLRTWLVLALRTLAVLALALVFARPFLGAARTDAAGEAERRVVLVVDASMSMQASRAGTPLLTAARSEAAELLRGLPPDSLAGVVFIGARPRPVLPALSRNLAALHEGLATTDATFERGEPAAAIAEALRMLEGEGDVYVFSDFQRTNWASVRFDAAPGVSVMLRPVTDEPIGHVGITAVSLSPTEPVRGEPLELTCTVFNASPTRRQEAVSLDMAGVSKTVEVSLQPYASSDVVFSMSAPPVGVRRGTVSLQADALPADNTRRFTVSVAEQLQVLLISDVDATNAGGAALYLDKALAPSGRGGIKVTRRRSAEADQGSIQSADVFVLAGPATLPGPVVEAVAQRVREGAALMCFLAGDDAAATVHGLAGASEGLIKPPFELTRQVRSERGEQLARLTHARGVLSVFDEAGGVGLDGVRVFRRYLTDNDPARQSEVLIRYQDGSVAMARGVAGRGAVVFFNLSPAPASSSFAGNPLFPVLMHEVLRDLRGGTQRDSARPGEPWHVSVAAGSGGADGGDDASGRFTVRDPRGEEQEATVVSRGREVRLAVDAVSAPGFYEIRQDGEPAGVAVVDVDPAETDTRAIDLPRLIEGAGGAGVAVMDADGGVESLARSKPWWPILLVIAAAALGMEMAVLALWRRPAHRAAPVKLGVRQ